MHLFKGASIFWVLFAGFSTEAFFFQLLHERGGSGVADAEAVRAAAEATGSFV
jgi:hypothetical protein